MRPEHVGMLACPESLRPLRLDDGAAIVDGRIRSGVLREARSRRSYPIVEYIPRFVSSENYAKGFGLEWTIHARTQHDEVSGRPLSAERFARATRWGDDLRGRTILEAGSGSGRFTSAALRTGALVCSVDYSQAVEANYQTNGGHENLLLVQADLCALPFVRASFDRVFCFGVLQHTPDPRRSFRALVDQLKPGGRIATDIYHRDVRHWLLQTKTWVRPFIRRSDSERLYRATRAYVDFMWPLARLIRRLPRIGPALNWRLLVADYSRMLPGAGDAALREWAHLDTFDMLAPEYDRPATLRAFRRWHEEAGLEEIDVHPGYNGLEGRARRPET